MESAYWRKIKSNTYKAPFVKHNYLCYLIFIRTVIHAPLLKFLQALNPSILKSINPFTLDFINLQLYHYTIFNSNSINSKTHMNVVDKFTKFEVCFYRNVKIMNFLSKHSLFQINSNIIILLSSNLRLRALPGFLTVIPHEKLL